MAMKEKIGVASVRLAVGILAGTTWLAAAQAQNLADAGVQRVVVTGSNIARIDSEGPTAVEIVSRLQIEKSGASTTAELLGKLPSVNIQLTGNDSLSFAGGASSAGLRGLDPKYTLILLNGRRLANYGFADGAENSFVDLNSIPLAAIDSVEILRDGASAIYGSDAVAGVINFRTRRDYSGMEVTGNIGANEKGDGSTGNVSVTKGWGDSEHDGYNVLLTVDALKRNSLQRGMHAGTANRDRRRYGGSDKRFTTEFQGSVYDFDTSEPSFVIPGCKGSIEVDPATHDNVCYTNPSRELTPAIERFGVSTIVTKRLSGNDELFAELGWNRNKTAFPTDYAALDDRLQVPTDGTTNPGVLGLPGPSADGTLAGFTPGDTLQVRHSITEAGRQVEVTTGTTLRLVGGWRGAVRGWDSELSLSLNQNKLRDEQTNQVLAAEAASAVKAGILGQGGYDPFNPANPASVVNPMLTTLEREATSRLGALEWKMSKPELFSYQGRPVGFAWGAQASHESIEDRPDLRAIAGLIVSQGGTRANASRSLYSAYGELSVPLLSTLEMQLAARADHYSDFGNSYNPKLALAWRPNAAVLLRGSATTSFKAPTLLEIGSTTSAYQTVADWARCGPLGYVGATCSYSPKAYLKGNPNLKAEKADNYALGMVWQASPALAVSLDWYGIHQRDTIQPLDAQYLIDHEDSIPGYAALIGRDPRNPSLEKRYPGLNKGRLHDITTPYINVGKTNLSGLDLDVKYDVALGAGKLHLRETNSYTLQFDQSVVAGVAPSDRLDGTNHPKWSNALRAAYELGQHELGLTAHTYAGTLNITDPTYTQDTAVTNARIPSYTVWDVNYSLRPGRQVDVNVGINNVFNRGVVYASSTYKDDHVQALNDVVGRYVYVNLRYVFN